MSCAHLTHATWDAATALLGTRDSRVIGNNTRLIRNAEDEIDIRYHSTDVIEIRRDGWLILRNGGWHTTTTAKRFLDYLPSPWRIGTYRTSGEWWVWHGRTPLLPFINGIAVHTDTASVGIVNRDGIAPMLSPDMVADIATAYEALQAARAQKRADRIAKQHPCVRPLQYRADVPHMDYASDPRPSMHGRARSYDCPRCSAERKQWDELHRATLAADHDAGHAWSVVVKRGTISAPAHPCPWYCPRKDERNV